MHIYQMDGKEYPSVTTIIKMISMNDELLKWANIMGFRRKDITAIQEETADFGTKVHSQLRTIIDVNAPEPLVFTDPRQDYEYSIIKRKFLEYFKDINYRTIDTEVTLISDKLGYGGTLDWLAKFAFSDSEFLFLNDFKTSKQPRATMFLQLGGYYNLLLEKGIDVDFGAIIITNQNICNLHPVNKETLQFFAYCFNSLFQFYNIWKDVTNFKPQYDIIDIIKKQPDNT